MDLLGQGSIESFRLENENKDKYQFVCLVIVCMSSCILRWETLCQPFVENEIWRKIVFTRMKFTKVNFVLPTH